MDTRMPFRVKRQGTRDDVWFSERGTPTPTRIDQRSRQSIDINERRPDRFNSYARAFNWESYERRDASERHAKAVFLRPRPVRKETLRAKSAGEEDILENDLIGSPGISHASKPSSSDAPKRPVLSRVRTIEDDDEPSHKIFRFDDSPASDASSQRNRVDSPHAETAFAPPVRTNTEDSAIISSDDSDYEAEHQTIHEIVESCTKELGVVSNLIMDIHKKEPRRYSYQLAWLVEEQVYHLSIWAAEAKINATSTKGVMDESLTLTQSVLQRLEKRAKRLAKSLAGFQSLLEEEPISERDLDAEPSDGQTQLDIVDPATLPTVQVEQQVKGMVMQLRTLRRLTRTVRESQDEAQTAKLRTHVKDILKHFGTAEACQRNGVGEGLPGDRALAKAKELAGAVTVSC